MDIARTAGASLILEYLLSCGLLIMCLGAITGSMSCTPGVTQRFEDFEQLPGDGLAAGEIDNRQDIQTFDPGVHVFPAAGFAPRLANWIDTHPQTQVICVTRIDADSFLVLTRPDPEWRRILPGAAAPPQ